ncbi:unannotated protein [freshwater metagenome]|uniref:Unannotated protein n=1 Tax=freshwater metagenome TaxID=449393 RepID=A0A6J6JHV9_9ZZZZ
MVERAPGKERTRGKESATNHKERCALSCDPNHHKEQCEEQQRGTKVFLVEHHEQRDTPRNENRAQILRMRKSKRTNLPLTRGNEFSLISQVGREENREGHLRDFTRLETDRAELHPNGASAAGVVPKTGNEREEKKAKAYDGKRVAIALKITRPLYPPQRENKSNDANRRPRRLRRCEFFVESGNDDIPESVQQRNCGQQDGIGSGRKFTNGEMGTHEQRDHGNEKRNDVGGNARVRTEAGKYVCRAHDDNSHQHEPKFGVSTARHTVTSQSLLLCSTKAQLS